MVENRRRPFAHAVRRDARVCHAAAVPFRSATGLPCEQKCGRDRVLTCRHVASVVRNASRAGCRRTLSRAKLGHIFREQAYGAKAGHANYHTGRFAVIVGKNDCGESAAIGNGNNAVIAVLDAINLAAEAPPWRATLTVMRQAA